MNSPLLRSRPRQGLSYRFLAGLGLALFIVLQGCAYLSKNGPPAAFFPTATPKPASPARTPAVTPQITLSKITLSKITPLEITPSETQAETPSSTVTLPAATPATPETDTPPAPTAPPVGSLESLQAVSQKQAMLPEAQADLEELGNLARYFITIEIDYTALSFHARSQLVYTNTENVSLDSLYFRLLPNGGKSYGNGSLAVGGVTQDGQPVETVLSLHDSVLEVKLAGPLNPGERTQIGMDFSGVAPGGNGQTGYGIYSFTRGVLALAGWYPQLAVYDDQGWSLEPVSSIGDSMFGDMAFFTVDVTTNRGLAVAATGVEVDHQESGAGEQLRFASGPAREFFIVVGDHFSVESRTVDGTRVNSYSLPGDNAAGKMVLGYAVDSIKHYNELFGRYPYKELDVVEAPMTYAAGVEFPGIVLITESLYQTMRQPFFTYVVAHEVGHQWWYNLVGNDVFDDPWLDEGLTTYTGALYWEAVRGSRAYQQSIDSFQADFDRVLQNGQDQPVTESLAYFEALDAAGIYGTVVYEKGALFFHYLRQEIGRTAFFKAIRAYFQEHEYGIATPEDLLDAFEKAAGRQLDAFYEERLFSKK